MTRQTPRMLFPYPEKDEDPFFEPFQQFTENVDASAFADADNNNLIGFGGAQFTWDAASGVLTWDAPFSFSGFTSGFAVQIDGPDSITIQPGQVLVFTMPRLLSATVSATLFVASRIAESDGVKIHDRIVIGARIGDAFYFRNGVTLEDGAFGQIWERPAESVVAGLTPAQKAAINSALHVHQEHEFTNMAGQSVLTLPDPAPETYGRFVVYRNGVRQREGASKDYTAVLVAPFQITLSRALENAAENVVVDAEVSVTV